MKIRFLQDHTPKGNSGDIETYQSGKVYDFPDSVSETYARKYVRLGLAEEVARKPAAGKAKKPSE